MNAIPFLNVLAPGITAGFAQAGKDAILQDMLANVNNLEVPKLGGEYGQAAYTGDFNPNAYADPEAAQYQQAQMDPQTLAARRAAIESLLSEGTGAAAAQQEASRRQALYDSANQAGAQSAGLREEMASRGKGGAGAEWAMRQRAGQSGANQAMLGGLQAQANGAQQRLAALDAYERSLGGLSDDQQSLNQGNANIVNQFNMANTNLRNQVAMANTGMQNQAQARNLDARQSSVNQNTGIRNANVDLQNQNKQGNFSNEAQKLKLVNGALGNQATAYDEANAKAQDAGKTGMNNFQSVLKMMGGGVG